MGNPVLAANISALRKHLGLKQAAFAELIGVDQSYVSKWERGSIPSAVPLAKISEAAGCPLDRFMKEPWAPNKPAANGSPALPSNDDGVVEIQKLDLSLSMGPGTVIDDWVEAEPVKFDLAFIHAITRTPTDRLKLVTGIGDSMYPTLNWGDAILIDTNDKMLSRQDGIYWIDLYGAAGLKRLRTVAKGRILVISDNASIQPQEVDAADLRIEGRAIWVARGL